MPFFARRNTRLLVLSVLALACTEAHVAPALDAGIDAPDDAATACAWSTCACPSAGDVTLSLAVDGAPREVALHVPARHACSAPSAVWIELGADDAPSDPGALDALSERDAFVVLRPTPRASARPWLSAGGSVDSGELRFVEAILSALPQLLPVDPARTVVAGRGTGAALAARMLGPTPISPSGVSLMAYEGPVPMLRTFTGARPRVWASTGYRAPGAIAQGELVRALEAAGFDGYALHLREADTGAASYGWLYEEAWAWVDASTWPENGPPQLPWRAERFPVQGSSLLAVTPIADGTLRAVAADARVYGTNASAKWGLLAELGGAPLLDVIEVPSGEVVVASLGPLARSADGLVFTRDATLPEIGPVIGLAVRADGALLGLTADGTLGTSPDAGRSWSALPSEPALRGGAAVAVSRTTGTALAVGRPAAIRRLAADGSSAMISVTTPSDWLSAVAAGADGTWWIVGDRGTVLRSTDDGLTFAAAHDPTGSSVGDLYTATVGESGALLAAGAHGTVVVCRDGASPTPTLAQWRTGGETYVGAVRWVDPTTALLLGENSLVVLGAGL
jgi:hypothetical protein